VWPNSRSHARRESVDARTLKGPPLRELAPDAGHVSDVMVQRPGCRPDPEGRTPFVVQAAASHFLSPRSDSTGTIPGRPPNTGSRARPVCGAPTGDANIVEPSGGVLSRCEWELVEEDRDQAHPCDGSELIERGSSCRRTWPNPGRSEILAEGRMTGQRRCDSGRCSPAIPSGLLEERGADRRRRPFDRVGDGLLGARRAGECRWELVHV
jgi:hypothetical protein